MMVAVHPISVPSSHNCGESSSTHFVPPASYMLVDSLPPPPAPASSGPPPPHWLCFSGPLVGRTVSVPETLWEPATGDPNFKFTGTIALQATDPDRVLVRFEYTGEKEWLPAALIHQWLQPDVVPLCDMFAAL